MGGPDMKKLPPTIKKNGFTYTQIIFCGGCYVYEQDYNSGIKYQEGDTPGRIVCYEVFRARVSPAETIHGKQYPEREVFPKDEDFGYTAWAMRDMETAIRKLMELKGHVQ